MNRYVYPYQCEDCGKRFPRRDQLGRHTRRTHPTEKVQCRWCHYSQPATDAYRVRKHELIHQKYLNLEPMATPSYTRGQVESVVQVPDMDDSCRQLMQELDASMPDFADLLGTEPRTPSPMRNLIGISAVASPPPEAVVPSDQLFSRYLSPVTSPGGTYSDEPVEPVPASVTSIAPLIEGAGSQTSTPEISATSSLGSTPVSSGTPGHTSVPVLDLSSRQVSVPVLDLSSRQASTPVTSAAMATGTTSQTSDCAQDLTSSQALASIPVSRAAMTSRTPGQTSVPVTSSPINAPMDLTRKERLSEPSKSVSDTAFQDEPLDLSVRGRPTTRVIPSQSFTNIIDCTTTISGGSWNPISIEVDPRDMSYNHMCHDPRLFFAGAPSAYMDHPLASTLQEKANLCKRNQKSQYQRHLTPVGVRTIIKEERCYLPDGTIYELRDIWTANSTTEE